MTRTLVATDDGDDESQGTIGDLFVSMTDGEVREVYGMHVTKLGTIPIPEDDGAHR